MEITQDFSHMTNEELLDEYAQQKPGNKRGADIALYSIGETDSETDVECIFKFLSD